MITRGLDQHTVIMFGPIRVKLLVQEIQVITDGYVVMKSGFQDKIIPARDNYYVETSNCYC